MALTLSSLGRCAMQMTEKILLLSKYNITGETHATVVFYIDQLKNLKPQYLARLRLIEYVSNLPLGMIVIFQEATPA